MKPFIAIHVESTGLSDGSAPCLFDAVAFDRGGNELSSFTCLLKPYDHAIWEDGAIQTHLIRKDIADAYGYDYKAVSKQLQEWIKGFTPVVADQVATEVALGRMGITLDKSELFDTNQLVHAMRLRAESEHERRFSCGVNPSIDTLKIQIHPWVTFYQGNQPLSSRNMARKIKEIFLKLVNR